jgi:hypothetical protein
LTDAPEDAPQLAIRLRWWWQVLGSNLGQAAPLRSLPDGVIDLDHLRVRRLDRACGVIHEYRVVA